MNKQLVPRKERVTVGEFRVANPRVSQRTGYFHLGDLIEVGPTDQIFLNPLHQLTEGYITGRFG